MNSTSTKVDKQTQILDKPINLRASLHTKPKLMLISSNSVTIQDHSNKSKFPQNSNTSSNNKSIVGKNQFLTSSCYNLMDRNEKKLHDFFLKS